MDLERVQREAERDIALDHHLVLLHELMKELRSAKVLTSAQLQAVEDRACERSGVGPRRW